MVRENLLSIALQSGALFLAIWAIFRLVPSIPAHWKAWVWRLAFLKPLICLLPFAVITLSVLPASPLPVAPAAGSLPSETLVLETGSIATPAPQADPGIDPLVWLWLAGAAAVGAYGLRNGILAARIVRSAEPVRDVAIARVLNELIERAEVTSPVRLLQSRDLPSAMLVGGRPATIVLPASSAGAGATGDLRMMLAHEVAHLARRDLSWFGVIWAVQSLFFFNPIVWLATRSARLDHESATDRHASELAGVPVQTYAGMLLRASVVTRTGLVPGAVPMAESYRTIHRRLEAMKYFNSPPSLWRKATIGALALTTLAFIPSYQLVEAAPQPSPEPQEQPKAKPLEKKPTPPSPTSTLSKARIQVLTEDFAKQNRFLKGKQGEQWIVIDNDGLSHIYVWKNGKLEFKKTVKTPKGLPKRMLSIHPRKPVQLMEIPKVKKARTTGTGVSRTSSTVSTSAFRETRGQSTTSSDAFSGGGQVTATGSTASDPLSAGGQVTGTGTNSGSTAFDPVSAGSGSISGQGTTTSAAGGTSVSGQAWGTTSGQASGLNSGATQGQVRSGQAWATTSGHGSGSSSAMTHGQAGSGQAWATTLGQGSGHGFQSLGSISGASDGESSTVSFNFQRFDVRAALQAFFRQTGRKCVLAPSVQGLMTVKRQNASFESALDALMRASNTTVRIEDGVYYFESKGL